MRKRSCSGQALTEYGVILALVAATLIGLQVYVQRGVQGGYKDATDWVFAEIRQARRALPVQTQLGLPVLHSRSHQYEPYYHSASIATESDSEISNRYEPFYQRPEDDSEEDDAQVPDSERYQGRSTTEIDHDTISRTGWRRTLPFSDEAIY